MIFSCPLVCSLTAAHRCPGGYYCGRVGNSGKSAGLGFSRGLTAAWWLLVGSIGLVVLGLFVAGRVRKTGVYTLPGLVEQQYGRSVALAASVLIVIAWLGLIAGQIIATGKIMSGSTCLLLRSPFLACA